MGRFLSPDRGVDMLIGIPRIPRPRGKVLQVLRKTSYSFDGRAAGATQTVILAEGIDARLWVSGALTLRLYSKNAWQTAGGGSTAATAVIAVDDLTLDAGAPGTSFAQVNSRNQSPPITATTVAPTLIVMPLLPPFGPLLRVSLRFAQGAAAAGGAQKMDIGVTMVGRRG